MPIEKVEFVAIDEIQMCADKERGHIFTDRLLNFRGKKITMFLGSQVMKKIIQDLVPNIEFINKERFSKLSYAGYKKISRLERKAAIIAFSVEEVYALAELIRRQKGGAAVIMGSLSPKTRNSQVSLYQSGDVDYLVATDAIGMGLNMDINQIFFSNLKKFDGRKTRRLNLVEISQIAGRAGRYKNDGSFGTTGDCEHLGSDEIAFGDKGRRGRRGPQDLKEKVMNHVRSHFRPEFINRLDEFIVFEPLTHAQIMEIVQLQCAKLAERVAGQRMALDLQPSAIDYLARKGFDPTYGARPVKRAIQSELIQVLANSVLRGLFEEDDTIIVAANGDSLTLTSGPKIVRDLVDQDEDNNDGSDFALPFARPSGHSNQISSDCM